ncbi:MAG: 4-hydroxybenzoate octaprenyltransferase [Oscillospiraceae bacterium]
MGFKKIKLYSELIMLSHSFFSLPFAITAMFMLRENLTMLSTIILIIALLAARSGANAFNRLADCEIDKKNQRTATRHLPNGSLKKAEVLVFISVCFIILIICAFFLNPICVFFAPSAISIMLFYSFTKRFTFFCHYVLGLVCGSAILGVSLGVNGAVSFETVIFFFAASLWISAFDIIYAQLDVDFDRVSGCCSIPARFGFNKAKKITFITQIFSVILLFMLGIMQKNNLFYFLGISIMLMIVLISQFLTKKGRILAASYNCNATGSIIFLLFNIIDIYMGG